MTILAKAAPVIERLRLANGSAPVTVSGREGRAILDELEWLTTAARWNLNTVIALQRELAEFRAVMARAAGESDG